MKTNYVSGNTAVNYKRNVSDNRGELREKCFR